VAEVIGYDIALAILAIMISAGGMILGIGYALDDKRIKEFGKSELYNTIISGVILGSLLAGFSPNGIVTHAINGITSGSATGFTCPLEMSYNSAICFAYNYVAGVSYVNIGGSSYPTVLDSTLVVLAPLSLLYTGLSILGSIQLNLGIINFGLSSSLKPLLTPIGYSINALSLSLIGIEVQGALLMFVSATALPILMPVGIVLRTLYFTRRLGGAIIAISIGLFAVFPLSYVLGATLVNTYSSAFSAGNVTNYISNAQGVQAGVLSQISTYQSQSHPSPVSAFNYITGILSGLLNGFGQFLNGLEAYISMLIIQVFFLPAFGLIITTISIREMARILGSEVHFGRLYII
jgi:hypothetical protein